MEVVVARKETSKEDVANFCLKEVVGNFATNWYKLVNLIDLDPYGKEHTKQDLK